MVCRFAGTSAPTRSLAAAATGATAATFLACLPPLVVLRPHPAAATPAEAVGQQRLLRPLLLSTAVLPVRYPRWRDRVRLPAPVTVHDPAVGRAPALSLCPARVGVWEGVAGAGLARCAGFGGTPPLHPGECGGGECGGVRGACRLPGEDLARTVVVTRVGTSLRAPPRRGLGRVRGGGWEPLVDCSTLPRVSFCRSRGWRPAASRCCAVATWCVGEGARSTSGSFILSGGVTGLVGWSVARRCWLLFSAWKSLATPFPSADAPVGAHTVGAQGIRLLCIVGPPGDGPSSCRGRRGRL